MTEKISHSQHQLNDYKLKLPTWKDQQKFKGDIRPQPRKQQKNNVPKHIIKPDYAKNEEGLPAEIIENDKSNKIKVLNKKQMESLYQAGKLGRYIMDKCHEMAKPGITTEQIDTMAHDLIIKNNAQPSPLNQYKFPKSICTSVNEITCHGIPDQRVLKQGDILKCDITVQLKGMHADLCESFPIGKVNDESIHLMKTTYNCLMKAIEICKPGVPYKEIGNIIENHAKYNGLNVIRNYCGHGVGESFHSLPLVFHYANNEATSIMKKGHCFTIEPILSVGNGITKVWPDKWSVVTKDGKNSAQFEHTLLINDNGAEIITKRNENSKILPFMQINKNRNKNKNLSITSINFKFNKCIKKCNKIKQNNFNGIKAYKANKKQQLSLKFEKDQNICLTNCNANKAKNNKATLIYKIIQTPTLVYDHINKYLNNINYDIQI